MIHQKFEMVIRARGHHIGAMSAESAPAPTSSETSDDAAMRGFLFALSAYTLWGVLPLFLKLVDHIPAIEVVAHRILWSVPIAGAVLLALGPYGRHQGGFPLAAHAGACGADRLA